MRITYRKKYGNGFEEKLHGWLVATWKETRDEDYFLRAGALPSGLGQRPQNPRPTALGRGRTGRNRPAGKGRRRHHKTVTKPPTASQIAQAAEQSAYVSYRDSLDAGAVPTSYQNVIDVRSRERWVEHKRNTNREAETQADLRRVNAELRELVTRAVKMGVDPVQVLAPVAREIKAQHRDLAA
jgi:hypothetical protein